MTLAARVIEPEWLDEMPAEDPRARRSRRDLARVNWLMANASIVAGELRRHVRVPRPTIVDLGAGDGTFALRVTRELEGARVIGVDRQPLPGAKGIELVRADVFEWLRLEPPTCDAIIVNLFLHHFRAAELHALFEGIADRANVFVACEPRRSSFALGGSHLLGLVGCNDVTRHDAVVSVRAGFRDGELTALWPDAAAWRCEERARGLFSHSFVAVRT